MRLEIDGGGYATASTAFADANRVAALHHGELTGRLRGYAAMAGDDGTSMEFAAAYDEAATEAVASLADVVAAFATLGRFTEASLAHHRDANRRSIINGAAVYDGGWLPDDGYVTVLPSSLPSSLGGDSPALSGHVAWILDHVQGFVWPDADVARLRNAAATWAAAAQGLDDLTTYCQAAVRGFWSERSPELPTAISATQRLEATIRDLVGQYAALATACEAYAQQVQEKRQQVVELAEWLLEQVVEGVVISVAVGAITAGAGGAAGLAAVVTRVAAEAPRFRAILEALRVLSAATAGAVRATRDLVRVSRVQLATFTRARLAVRSEAGQIGWGGRSSGWLRLHERWGGHTLEKHVGRTDVEHAARLEREPWIAGSSSFTDEAAAERALSDLLDKHRGTVETWLQGGRDSLTLRGDAGWIVGRHLDRSGMVNDVRGVKALLVRDSSMPEGYRVVTAYPRP